MQGSVSKRDSVGNASQVASGGFFPLNFVGKHPTFRTGSECKCLTRPQTSVQLARCSTTCQECFTSFGEYRLFRPADAGVHVACGTLRVPCRDTRAP